MSFTQESRVHASIEPGKAAFDGKDFDINEYKTPTGISLDAIVNDMSGLGIHISADNIKVMGSGASMDALQPLQTAASVVAPVQFLQEFLPGFVNVATAERTGDDLVGVLIAGDWKDEEIVQGIIEQTGTAVPYGDYTNVPHSSYNTNWNKATIVRFEDGFQVGQLEQARASSANVDSASQKRIGSLQALEIARNNVCFNGYNAGANKTFGFLNADGLPAYIAAPSVVGWASATYLQIVNDLLFAFSQLQTQTQAKVNPRKIETVLAIANDSESYLSRSTDFGYSVRKWLSENYPLCRIAIAPQLDNANGGASVFYLYPEKVADASTDGGKTFIQPVPTKFMTLGVQQLVKSYEEDYLNATAGVMCKRPWAVVRITNI